MGQNKQEECSWNGAARASVQPWIEAMKNVFTRCSKKMAVQVCTELWLHNYAVERKLSWVICSMLSGINYDFSMIRKPDFFCRLKINHDSHEFILEFSTVATAILSSAQSQQNPAEVLASTPSGKHCMLPPPPQVNYIIPCKKCGVLLTNHVFLALHFIFCFYTCKSDQPYTNTVEIYTA